MPTAQIDNQINDQFDVADLNTELIGEVIDEFEKENPLIWASKHREIKGKSFSIHRKNLDYRFLQEIYSMIGRYRSVVIQKPTQVGATEMALNSAFYFLDNKKENVIYMLPTKGQLGDFAHQRIDRAIEQSSYLKNMFSDVSNVGLKQAKNGAMYLRGARTKSGLEEVPAGYVIRDEIDRMDPEMADLALKRLGGSQYKWRTDLSHPTYPGSPIDKEYKNSTQGKWKITCPECQSKQSLDWHENYWENAEGETGNLQCRNCGADWNKSTLLECGEWEHRYPKKPIMGYQFSQLLSPTVTLDEQAKEFSSARKEGGYKIEQFHNTVLGMPFAVEGSKLTKQDVYELAKAPPMGEKIPGPKNEPVMGVDVGNILHYWIQAKDKVFLVGSVDKFNLLEPLIDEYNVGKVVIDAMPETRAARAFINSLPIKGWLCRRSDKLESGKLVKDEEIKVNKTEHFDKFFAQFNNKEIQLPSDLPEEAVDHLTDPVRVIEEGKDGVQKAVWKKGVCHIADAGMYAKEAQNVKGNENNSGFLW